MSIAPPVPSTDFHTTLDNSFVLGLNPKEDTYDESHDKAEVFAHGGRPWIHTMGGFQRDPRPILSKGPGITILSYNVFADCKCQNIMYSTMTKWEVRCKHLIKEIASYNADVLCLQDVDHFKDFWRPQLMVMGYDSVYKKRTDKRSSHYEGVVIAYRRDILQLFKTNPIEFNKAKKEINTSEMGASFGERLVTDDVGLLCFLQPWGTAGTPSDLYSDDKEDTAIAKEMDDYDYDSDSASIIISAHKEGSITNQSRSSNRTSKQKPPMVPLEGPVGGGSTASLTEGSIYNPNPKVTRSVQSAFCIGCALFSSREGDSKVRYFHAQYFAQCIERENKDFQVPVLMGVSLFDTPDSEAYHVLRTGRMPMRPQAPRKINTPRGYAYCRGSCTLKWKPPVVTREDPPLLAYRIAWRPGGSSVLGFRQQIEVDPISCLAYGERIDERGVRKSYQLDELQFNITGLTSELPFEFIVAAVNEIGEGIWSDPSMPVTMSNPARAPPMPSLIVLKNAQEVQESRELSNMYRDDWDVEIAVNSDPMKSRTQLTPRLVDGRKNMEAQKSRTLPLSVNPREGWRRQWQGGTTVDVEKELHTIKNMNSTILRDEETGLFLNRDGEYDIVDSPRGKRAFITGSSHRVYLQDRRVQDTYAIQNLTQTVTPQLKAVIDMRKGNKNNTPIIVPALEFNQSIASLSLQEDSSMLYNPENSKWDTASYMRLAQDDNVSVDFMGTLRPRIYNKQLRASVAMRRLDDSLLDGKGDDGSGGGSQLLLEDEEGFSDGDDDDDEKGHENPNDHTRFQGHDEEKEAQFMTTNETTASTAAAAHHNGEKEDGNVDNLKTTPRDNRDSTIHNNNEGSGAAPVDQQNDTEEGDKITMLPDIGYNNNISSPMRRRSTFSDGTPNGPLLKSDDDGDNVEKQTDEGVTNVSSPHTRAVDIGRRRDHSQLGTTQEQIDALAEKMHEINDESTFNSGTSGTAITTLYSDELAAEDERNLMLAIKAKESALYAEEKEKMEMEAKDRLLRLRDPSRLASKINDSTIMDGADLFKNLGRTHFRQLHDLGLRSAYEQYSTAGEPLYTTSYPSEEGRPGVFCGDYIFYSKNSMYCTRVCALPEITMLSGSNPREILCKADPYYQLPASQFRSSFNQGHAFEPKGGYGHTAATRSDINNCKKQILAHLDASTRITEMTAPLRGTHGGPTGCGDRAFWGGIWSPMVDKNEKRDMQWLPNDTFASSHMAMGAHISFLDGYLAGEWR